MCAGGDVVIKALCPQYRHVIENKKEGGVLPLHKDVTGGKLRKEKFFPQKFFSILKYRLDWKTNHKKKDFYDWWNKMWVDVSTFFTNIWERKYI